MTVATNYFLLQILQQNNNYNIKSCYYTFYLKYIPPKTNITIKNEKPNNTMFVKFLIFFCKASICSLKSATTIVSLETEDELESWFSSSTH